jgi:hypothetical protein
MRVEMGAVPGHKVEAAFPCPSSYFPWVVVTEFIDMAAHHPVVVSKAADNFVVHNGPQPMIRPMRNLHVAFMKIVHFIREGCGHLPRDIIVRTIQADNPVIQRKLVAAPFAKNTTVVLGDQQAKNGPGHTRTVLEGEHLQCPTEGQPLVIRR